MTDFDNMIKAMHGDIANARANWPHEQPFTIVNGKCGVCGYDYELGIPEFVSRIRGFAAEMREQAIHVGLGSPPVCVTCDQPWPCPESAR